MDDDAGPYRSTWPKTLLVILAFFLLCAFVCGLAGTSPVPGWSAGSEVSADAGEEGGSPESEALGQAHASPIGALGVAVLVLLFLSAFFSGSETAFLSIHRVRLRNMREEGTLTGRLVAQLMDRPGRLLTTILVGNMCVNIFIAILLGTRVAEIFVQAFHVPPSVGYLLAVVLCTSVLVLFGEITPKLLAVRTGERFARSAVLPLLLADKVLSPARNGLLHITNAIFRITRFIELRAAPFITDDELKSALSVSEAQGVIEEEERQMIQGILEFSDALLREILVPRPDVIALPEEATVAEALAVFREHEYSRMPTYKDDLDHVTGLLVVKDLLPSLAKGDEQRLVKTLARPPHFVPETMTIQQFVNDAQRGRRHMAIVVDEYGGTEGVVTLEDAIEEVVGDIMDEDEAQTPPYEQVDQGVFRVEGSMPLDEVSDLIGIELKDEEHETVGGFFMDRTDRIPEAGDRIEYAGVRFTVEACEGKRVASVRVELLSQVDAEEGKS